MAVLFYDNRFLFFRDRCKQVFVVQLVPDKVVKGLPFPDQDCPALMPKHFGGSKAGIVIAGHGKTISARISKTKDIPLGNFIDPSVTCKSVGLTDIPNYGIITFPTFGVGEIDYLMCCPVEHRTDQVVKTGI